MSRVLVAPTNARTHIHEFSPSVLESIASAFDFYCTRPNSAFQKIDINKLTKVHSSEIFYQETHYQKVIMEMQNI